MPGKERKEEKKRKADKEEGDAKKPRKERAEPPSRAETSAMAAAAGKAAEKVITVEPENATELYPPVERFKDLTKHDVPKWLLDATCKGFDKPTPVQARAWPVLFAGLDCIAVARTGSGKTLAFGIPGLMACLAKKQRKKKPRVLVLAPTRELATQTARVVEVAAAAAPSEEESGRILVSCVYGGVDKKPQRQELLKASVVVATPGRLLDLMEEGAMSLDRVSLLVLDEADRMLDMGFEPAVRAIVSSIRGQGNPRADSVQTVMFSATWPSSIRKLASEFLKSGDEIVKISVGGGADGDDGPVAARSVTQAVFVLDNPRDKDRHLIDLLKKHHAGGARTIVFCLYKKEAARVESQLQRQGWDCVSLHGDKSQVERTKAFNAFRDSKVGLLIATDVASRGVDLPNVEHVINYTFPLTIEDYVHRIGRTGRGDSTGFSHTLFTPDDKAHAGGLVNVLQTAGQEVPEGMYQFSLTTKKKLDPTYGAFGPRADLIGKTGTKITFDSDDDN